MVDPRDDILVRAVSVLCEEHGYDRVMQLASLLWKNKMEEDGVPGSYFVIGPHKSMVVSCGCDSPSSCDWCCGSGWVTRHVNVIKNGVIDILIPMFQKYLRHGKLPSGFAEAVLRNDLSSSVMYADSENIFKLKHIVSYLNRELPDDSWGSNQAVNKWVSHGGIEGLSYPEKRRYSRWL